MPALLYTKAVRGGAFIIKSADYAAVRQTNFIADKCLFIAHNPIKFGDYGIEIESPIDHLHIESYKNYKILQNPKRHSK
jgi:hypothetical protein